MLVFRGGNGSVKKEMSSIVVTFQIQPFSTSRIMGERVITTEIPIIQLGSTVSIPFSPSESVRRFLPCHWWLPCCVKPVAKTPLARSNSILSEFLRKNPGSARKESPQLLWPKTYKNHRKFQQPLATYPPHVFQNPKNDFGTPLQTAYIRVWGMFLRLYCYGPGK